MSPVWVEPTLPESSLAASSKPECESPRSVGEDRRFVHLRGVQWRINLGILPSSSSSIDDLRRVTADSRRRYAGLRRRLLVDPHLPKDGSNSPGLVMDNPLSQNPDSMWGRFFRNAELEKMVDQDLSRLYPEHESYFQTLGCQGMLRRILLLWCLKHPVYGYRQGMHELLAPLLYVLHMDVERLSEVRKLYEDHFTDKFDGLSFNESDMIYKFDLKKFPDSMEDEIASHGNMTKVSSLNELDPEIQSIVLLSDAYGAEGELGIVLSEKFMEHDAYCMFDALMSGAHGAVAMADFFSPSPAGGSHTGLPPVIEASSALYHLLSIVDASLHSHLVELGVEPQYFALRWLRVLFGREFSLEGLLIIWDEIFASDNGQLSKAPEEDVAAFGVLSSPRGAFISAMAVSMLLHLRSSLLATENATSCLQRLLNFPGNVDLKKLIEKARSLQAVALDANVSSPFPSTSAAYERSRSVPLRANSLSSDSVSPKTPQSSVPESYWEEQWRVLHKAEELRHSGSGKQDPTRKKGWSEKVRLSLSRAESDPSPAKVDSGRKDPRLSTRRSLLDDLSRELGLEKDIEKTSSNEVSGPKGPLHVEVDRDEKGGRNQNFNFTAEERCLSGNTGSEENSSIFSSPTSPFSRVNDHDSEKSSVASNLSLDENDYESNNVESLQTTTDDSPLPVSDPPENALPEFEFKNDSTGKPINGLKERKLLPGKLQWLWKFGRNAAGEGTSEKGGAPGVTKSTNGSSACSVTDRTDLSSLSTKGDAIDQNVMVALRNLGQSMVENIQVIETAFQQDRGQVGTLENLSKNVLVGKGQVTAMAALKELRKISNLLSEM
ncbi:uncharacterized protein LOC131165484 [Malania oleifera]|uniref:uncharacterized protein LOC131165484 n=1 Tax=Malania oleifera TaxID=397392 RepID=UPI0025AE1CC0|nr:uncharacterized protein LOC131165484 [Malania oleifera]